MKNRTDLASALRSARKEGDEGTVAVVVERRPDNSSVHIEADRVFHAASTMKVAVLVEAYRQIEEGERSLDALVPVHNRFRSVVDNSTYAVEDDSDDALHDRVGEEERLGELLRRMIVVSSNLATNCVLEAIGVEAVQATVDRLGADGMHVRRGVEDLAAYEAGINNTTTAEALATLLTALARGEAVSPDADRAMIDLLRQQHFRDGIPAGLSSNAIVANKTGWTSTVQHDAAIVEPPAGEPYVLVVLTEGFASAERAKRSIAQVAAAVHGTMGAAGRNEGGKGP
jgi:beta-lactamase class A